MSKVIQVRGVPDELHAKLVAAADEQGKSLTAFVRDELDVLAQRAEAVAHNRRVFAESQAEFAGLDISRQETRRAVDEGRHEREIHADEQWAGRGA